ncbi:MAG: type IV toxin-antitoxin system AbiEi family antitoxin domain-containing protein [Dermatophilaceae bacterium]
MSGDRQDVRRRLHALAFGQAGYFSAAQARKLGYTYQAQKYHVDQGNWHRVDRGLFRLPGWPSGREDTYARWAVWSGGRGVVSHDSALAVHGLSDANPARVHLTVPPGFGAVDDAVVTHGAELAAGDVEDRGAWRVTAVERTLLDVSGGSSSQELVDDAVADALDQDLTTTRRLLRRSADATDRAALRLERALARANGRG